jgi:hypothetical protein
MWPTSGPYAAPGSTIKPFFSELTVALVSRFLERHLPSRVGSLFADGLETEVLMHIGSLLVVIWLVIGGVAAAQRGDFKANTACGSVATIGVTILAGPLNYTGVDPHINCTTPRPSN